MKPYKSRLAQSRSNDPVRAGSLLEERRRSQRVMLRTPVLLYVPGRTQAVRGMTVSVSEIGAMIVIPEPLAAGTKLNVENPNSNKKVAASVTRPPRVTPEGALHPVEFSESAPAFWDIVFPPLGN
jgi:hypothetical protein